MAQNSIFNKMLKFIPLNKFQEVVLEYNSDRYFKSFKTWDHLAAMLYHQVSPANSLRDIQNTRGIKRSTLSDANSKRDAEVFGAIAKFMVKMLNPKINRELSKVVELVDSTPIRVSGRGSEWADKNKTRESCKGFKVHIQYCAQSGAIGHLKITEPNINDITVAQEMAIESGKIYVFDKGYCDYNWQHNIHEAKSFFVTRLKSNAQYSVKETLPIKEKDAGKILSVQLITLTNKKPRGGKTNKLAGQILKLVAVKHPTKNRTLKVVTNAIDKEASEIAWLYKERWQIELYFKWMKQNLKLKKFCGESKNAISIQIYVAIIAYVLISLLKNMYRMVMRLKDLAVIIKTSLFASPALKVCIKECMRPRRSEMRSVV